MGDMLYKLIFVNVALFALATIVNVFSFLMRINAQSLFTYFELPSSLSDLPYRFWTIITYMFFHTNVIHILFNMLWLYWFGKIFNRFYSGRQLCGLYILGGIVGGLFYILAYNIFPAFDALRYSSYLLGASASVLAIVVAVAMRIPNDKIYLMFLGGVKIKYIAIFVVALSFLNSISDNAGGEIAHLGGAFAGFMFGYLYKSGTDITKFINSVIDYFTNLFRGRHKARMNVRMGDKYKDMAYNSQRKASQDEIDDILDKMKKTGYDCLSNDEKRKLFNAGK